MKEVKISEWAAISKAYLKEGVQDGVHLIYIGMQGCPIFVHPLLIKEGETICVEVQLLKEGLLQVSLIRKEPS